MPSSRFLAVDCGAAHVACGLFARSGKGSLKLLQFASAPLAYDPADEAAWLQALEHNLAEMLAREKFGVRKCVLTVPGHLTLSKLVKTPAVGREQRPRVVQFEASQNIPYPLDEVTWNYLEMGDDGADMEFMLSAVKLDAMEALCGAVESTGLRVLRAEPTGVALWRAYNLCMATVESTALLVDIGARSTQVIFSGAGAMHMRTLALGGNTVTQAIASQLQLGFTDAEHLKLAALTGGPEQSMDGITQEAIATAGKGFADRLQQELKRSQLAYLRLPGAVAPQRMIITGSGAKLPGLAEQLGAKLAVPVENFSVASGIELISRARLDGAAIVGDRLANLVGLAVPFTKPDIPVLDLLPSTRRDSLAQKQGRKGWLATAALLVLLPLAPMAYYMKEADRLERLSREMQAYAEPMRRMERTNEQNLERIKQLKERMSVLQAVAKQRTNWVTWLADTQKHLAEVGDVWLDSLHLETETTGTGSDEGSPEVRMALTGRLLDPETPPGAPSQEALGRARDLFRRFAESSFVKKAEGERFVGGKPGILRFEVTLVMNPENPL